MIDVFGDLADVVLIHQAGSKIVGFVAVKADVVESTASVVLLAVDPAYRGRGIGKMLLSSAISWSFDCNCSSIKVVTQASNTGALALYQSAGFHVEASAYECHIWSKPIPFASA